MTYFNILINTVILCLVISFYLIFQLAPAKTRPKFGIQRYAKPFTNVNDYLQAVQSASMLHTVFIINLQ